MIIKALALIALFLPNSARADVSDSGNLTIGGQGVIQGTMTVQGSEFSVGGATFTVAGGSVTLGGGLNVAAGGIKWADGTMSTTASAGGGGNAVLGATQAFSGANTFTSSVTITGPAMGLWIEISSASIVNSSGYTFTGLSSSVTYRLEWRCNIKTTAGSPALRFNGDAGSNYRWATKNLFDNGDETLNASSVATHLRISYFGATTYTGMGQATFASSWGLPKSVLVMSESAVTNQTQAGRVAGGGKYNGSADLSSVTFLTAAGTTDAELHLFRRWDK